MLLCSTPISVKVLKLIVSHFFDGSIGLTISFQLYWISSVSLGQCQNLIDSFTEDIFGPCSPNLVKTHGKISFSVSSKKFVGVPSFKELRTEKSPLSE